MTELLRNFWTRQSFPWIAWNYQLRIPTYFELVIKNLLAYEISATLSLLKQFQRWLPRAFTNCSRVKSHILHRV